MIKIIYVADPEGGKLTMRAEGHAGYAPAGQDIVCAAVSVLVQTLANKVDAAARSGRLLTSCVQHRERFVLRHLRGDRPERGVDGHGRQDHPDLRRAFPGRDGPAAGAGPRLADGAQQPGVGMFKHRERHL